MRVYIDEDLASQELRRSLRKAGDVLSPHDAGRLGDSDTMQLIFAIQNHRACITRNSSDFQELHDLVIACGGSHPGILTIHSDNDRRRDMKPAHVVAAIANIEAVITSVRNLILSLNDWR